MGLPITGRPATWTMAKDQTRAVNMSRAQANSENGSFRLSTSDDQELDHLIYIYNILNREHVVEQPPLFPKYRIPACKPGEKFAYNILPAYINLPYERVGEAEKYYRREDGRKSATSLLNPAAFPGTVWEAQLQKWAMNDAQFGDQYGNNLNRFGCFWSLTMPDEEEKLDEEIKIFKEIATETMKELVTQGEAAAAAGDLKSISPLIHFAMDYFGRQAPWHMSATHMVHCPTCGELVQDGIAYHKNSMGEKCIIDVEKYKQIMSRQRQIERELATAAEQEEQEPVETAAGATKRAPRKKTT